MRRAIEQGRLLGTVGSLILFTFLVALFYSIFGQKRIMRRIVAQVAPMQTRVPETVLPFILSAIRVVVADILELVLKPPLILIEGLKPVLLQNQALGVACSPQNRQFFR